MNAKQFLQDLSRTNALIRGKKEALEELRTMAEAVSKPLRPDRVQSSRRTNSTEDLLIKIADLEERLSGDVETLVKSRTAAMMIIDRLDDDRHIAILYMRYLSGRSWAYISDRLGYDRRWVLRLHGHALQEFEKEATKSHIKPHKATP